MSHWTKWAGVALVVFLLSGCKMCNCVERAVYFTCDPDFSSQGPPVQQPPEQPTEPNESESPPPGNAFSSLVDNKFTWEQWHYQRRIYMPVAASAP